MSEIVAEARVALRELIALLSEVDRRFLSSEWNLMSPADIAEATRSVMHSLQGGLALQFERAPERPAFRRIVTPWRKFTGDNADAIYFDAPVSAKYAYRVRGNVAGAVYVSITVEAGVDGGLGGRTAGVINDTQFDVAADGSFELQLGGAERARNWLPLPEDAFALTTRHYFEEKHRSRSASAAPRASSTTARSACPRWRTASSPRSCRRSPISSRRPRSPARWASPRSMPPTRWRLTC